MDYTVAYEQAKKYGQEHIFSFWDELTTDEQTSFLEELKGVDYELMQRLYEKTTSTQAPRDYSTIQPAPVIQAKDEGEAAHRADFLGAQALNEGKVALFLLAGGLGSRLGFDGPKGFFEVTPVKKKTLFEVFAEKILAKQRKHGVVFDWYIMTNPHNHDAIVEFFANHNFFGLDKKHVLFFPQRVLPAVDKAGKFLLKSKHSLFWGPDGAGGFFNALADHGIMKRMEEKSIEHLFCFNVDNPLVNILDERYIGYHLLNKAWMSNKVVKKTYPEEKVGLLVKNLNNEGRVEILEYTHLSEEDANKQTEDGELLYNAGNIANYILKVSFIKDIQDKRIVDYKPAFKRFMYLDSTGTLINSQEPNGYKFESFVFDAMYNCDNAMTYMVRREEEFAPVKNAQGKDSPQVACDMQIALAKNWMVAAGISQNLVDALEEVEISPLFADTKEEFVKKVSAEKDIYEEALKAETSFYFGDEAQ